MSFYPLGRGTKSDLFRSLVMLIDLCDAAILLFNSQQNRILYANRPFCDLCGYYLSDLLRQSPEELLAGERIEDLADGTDIELSLRHKKGHILSIRGRWMRLGLAEPWAVLRVVPSENDQAIVQRWWLKSLSVLQSLPELFRKGEASQAVQGALEILAQLYETPLMAVYRVDSYTPILRRMACVGEDTVLPEDLPASDLARLASGAVWFPGRRISTELHRIARLRNLSYVISAPIGFGQALVGLLVVADFEKEPPSYLAEMSSLVATYIDVIFQYYSLSESRALEKAIQERRDMIWTTIMDNSHEGVLVLDSGLLVEDINPTAEMMLGYSRSEVIGQPVENILVSPDRVMPTLISASHGKATPSLPGVTLHRRNGQSFPADLKVLPVERDGQLLAVVVLMNDISESEQIRAQTRQLEQRAFLGEFMGVFAHEVLNPLNGISTGLQLLASRLGEDSPHRDLIQRMESDCNRLAHQMEALKSLSKPYEPKQEPVDVGEVVARLVDRWRPRMARLKITPILQIEEHLPKVMGDWRALEQVFMNLISNAMDAMSQQDGGVLSVRIKRNDSEGPRPQVEIAISDNGPGIPDEIREKIFQPFVTTKPHGTGLGLPITKRIVTAHRGTIKVNSFPGGTVFHVFLPAILEKEDGIWQSP